MRIFQISLKDISDTFTTFFEKSGKNLSLSYIFHTSFSYKYHLYHQKTSFVNSFHQKVVFVASYVCLAFRGRQKWYSWYSQDISLTSLKSSQTLLLRVPSLSIPLSKNAVLVGYLFTSFCIITHYYANNFEVLRSNNNYAMI